MAGERLFAGVFEHRARRSDGQKLARLRVGGVDGCRAPVGMATYIPAAGLARRVFDNERLATSRNHRPLTMGSLRTLSSVRALHIAAVYKLQWD